MENKMEVQIFNNEEFGQVRIATKDSEPWFVAKDVCSALDIDDVGRATGRLDDDELTRIKIESGGQRREMIIVNEPGLYSLVLSSRKPEAKKFKRWITHEVIPTIRKTGGYVNNDDLFVDTYLPMADENTKNLFRLQLKTIRQLNGIISDQNKTIEDQKLLVEFAEAVSNTKDCIDVGQMAKILRDENIKVGRNRLFDWLRENDYLMKNNTPYQKHIESGLFIVKEIVKNTAYGSKVFTKTYVTGKGQIHITEKLREKHGDVQ